jgi:hypothetical protein
MSSLMLNKSQILLVFAKKRDVDYLLIAKPVAFNHLGIRHDCAVSFVIRLVVGSSLSRPPFLLLMSDRKQCV